MLEKCMAVHKRSLTLSIIELRKKSKIMSYRQRAIYFSSGFFKFIFTKFVYYSLLAILWPADVNRTGCTLVGSSVLRETVQDYRVVDKPNARWVILADLLTIQDTCDIECGPQIIECVVDIKLQTIWKFNRWLIIVTTSLVCRYAGDQSRIFKIIKAFYFASYKPTLIRFV